MVFTQEDFQSSRETQAAYVRHICIAGMILLWGVYTPLICYHGLRFYRNRHFQVLKKRYSGIVTMEIVLVLLSQLLTGCVMLADYLRNAALRNASFYSGLVVQYAIIYCWLWRFWLLFFDMKWMNESLNVEWKRLLDPKLGAHRFFIDARSSWGRKRWIGQRVLALITVSSAIVVGLRIKFDFSTDSDLEIYGEIPYLVFLGIPFMALAVMLCAFPRFDDNIYISVEMRSVMAVLLFILVAFGVQEFVENRHEKEDDAKNVGIAVNVVYYAVIESSNTVCILIATFYVMKMVEPLLSEERRSGFLAATTLSPEMAAYVRLNDDLLELNSVRKHSDDPDADRQDISLLTVLSHSKSFDLFVHFVASEFSMECLLCFVEMIQFKQWMLRHLRVTRSEDAIKQKSIELFHSLRDRTGSFTKSDIAVDLRYGSPSLGPSTAFSASAPMTGHEDDRGFLDIDFGHVPKSRIVFDEDLELTTNRFTDRSKHKIYKLYAKYVRSGSELEVNISGRSRLALANMMDDYERWMRLHKYEQLDAVFLMHIFDKVIDQMFELLTASYRRFKHSPKFAKLAQSVLVDCR